MDTYYGQFNGQMVINLEMTPLCLWHQAAPASVDTVNALVNHGLFCVQGLLAVSPHVAPEGPELNHFLFSSKTS
jgi:hypothetical protein